MDAHDIWQVAAWAALHAGGIATAWISRWHVGRQARVAVQSLLTSLLCLVAGLTVFQLAGQFHLALLSATTLVLMVLAAVVDWPREERDPLVARFAAIGD